MYILGICNDETASACLMKNGEIIFAASEERFSRKKLDNSFPQKSIESCLNFAKIELKDVDAIAYAWAKGFQEDLVEKYLILGARCADDKQALDIAKERIKWEIDRDKTKRKEFDDWVEENIDQRKQTVFDFFHHEAHAASAAFYSPFDEGFVYTSDGRGDFEATTIYKFNRHSNEALTKIFSTPSSNSFGFFYGRITGLLGFKPMRHEGKITGLAAFGDPTEAYSLMQKMIEVKSGDVHSNFGDYYRPFFSPYSELLESEIKKFKREDIAAAAQLHLENMMVELLDFYLKENDVDTTNLMCAGGVFGNVKVTQKLKEMKQIDNCFVQPQMGDGGLCLGACALAHKKIEISNKQNTSKVKKIKSMYLGPNATYRSITQTECANEFCYEKIALENAPVKFAKSLENRNVIGLINGRMEFGPRALCNRSIIVPTSDKTINDWLNKRMNRTEFMPFAPVLRKEIADKCIIAFDSKDITLNFMTSTVDCTEDFAKNNPAVVHVDKTARPQIVTESSNKFIWKVLYEWEKISDESSLVNTSFNVHEEPIICDIDEGIVNLRNGVIDELWVVANDSVDLYKKKSK